MSDYISRDELLELYPFDPDCEGCSVPYPIVRQNILDMPAADVAEVRHGRWINNTFCSCCGGFDEDDKGNIIQSFHNYCPACGARMDKEDEHETG